MRNNFVVKLAIATVACFFLSFVISKVSGKEGGYPDSVVKRYVAGFKCTPPSPATEHSEMKEEIRKVDAKGIHEVEFNTISSDVQVVVSDSKQIEMKGASPGSISVAEQVDGDILRFTENKVGGIASSGLKLNCLPDIASGLSISVNDSDQSKYILSIPKGVERLHIHTVSGDIQIDVPTLQKYRVETVSGDVKMKVADIHPIIDLDSISGDLKLTCKKTLCAHFHLSTVSGEEEVMDGKASDDKTEGSGGHSYDRTFGSGEGSIRAKTVSGDVHLTLE